MKAGHAIVVLKHEHSGLCPHGPVMYRAWCTCGWHGSLCHEAITPRMEINAHKVEVRNGVR